MKMKLSLEDDYEEAYEGDDGGSGDGDNITMTEMVMLVVTEGTRTTLCLGFRVTSGLLEVELFAVICCPLDDGRCATPNT